MPYSTPGEVHVQSVQPNRPRNHTRTSYTFTDERGPGAHKPLTSLPRRRSHVSSNSAALSIPLPSSTGTSSPKRAAMFRIGNDEEDEEDDSDDGPTGASLPALKLRPGNFLRLNTQDLHSPIPFPRSSPLPSPTQNPLYNPQSPHPSFPRTNSNPIILSNGKPLKSSLKSSSSSPVICNQSVIPSITRHIRARSAPTTPRPASPENDNEDDDTASWASYSPVSPPKSVHFAENGTLESVRLFNSFSRPRSVSMDCAVDDTETETETESARQTSFPFPRIPAPRFELDTASSSRVPAQNPSIYSNVHLEAVSLANGPGGAPVLAGTLLARNVAFEKIVALRFTLDDWQTTSEVRASYAVSFPSLPPALRAAMNSAPTEGDVAAQGQGWDRFTFSIRLADHAQRLDTRTMWLVARYTATGVGEWWDNNDGKNYRIGFKPASPPTAISSLPNTKRLVTVSAPTQAFSPPRVPSPPPSLPSFPSPPLMVASSPLTPPASTTSSPFATVTIARLSRLSLSNYAAPRPSIDVPPSPPLTPPHRENAPALPSPSMSIVGGQPTTVVTAQPTPTRNSLGLGFGAYAGTHGEPVTLHWPWGGSTVSSGSPAAASIEHLEKREKAKKEGMLTPPGSVSSASSSPVMPFAKVLDRARAGLSGSPAPSPRGSPSDSGDESSGSNSPSGGKTGAEIDSLYNAFVKQWCFAQGPANVGSGVVVG